MKKLIFGPFMAIVFAAIMSVIPVSCDNKQKEPAMPVTEQTASQQAAEEMHSGSNEKTAVAKCGGVTSVGYNPFPCCSNNGNCTWYAYEHGLVYWPKLLLPMRGNAITWADVARQNGFVVTAVAEQGDIAIGGITFGSRGHVAAVSAVSGSNVKVNEQNCDFGPGGVLSKTYAMSKFNLGYLKPIKLTTGSLSVPSSVSYGKAFVVSGTTAITGYRTFNGTMAIALHSTSGAYLRDLYLGSASCSAGKSITSKASVTTTTSKQISKGSYKIVIKFKPNNSTVWSDLKSAAFSVK